MLHGDVAAHFIFTLGSKRSSLDMAGIKLMTLSYAAWKKKKIYIASMKQWATVTIRKATVDANHSHPLDFVVTLEDERSYKVCWDQFFRAHVLDSSDHETELEVSEGIFDAKNAEAVF